MTNEDLVLIRKFDELKQRGYYCDSKQLCDLYNKVLNKHRAPTSCGACLRSMISELVDAANKYEREMAHRETVSRASNSVEESEPTAMKEEENKAVRRARKSK